MKREWTESDDKLFREWAQEHATADPKDTGGIPFLIAQHEGGEVSHWVPVQDWQREHRWHMEALESAMRENEARIDAEERGITQGMELESLRKRISVMRGALLISWYLFGLAGAGLAIWRWLA